MIIGVPFCAIVYAGVRMLVHNRLEQKNLNPTTENYVTIERINEDGTFVHKQEIIENKKFDWRTLPFVRYFVEKDKTSITNKNNKKQ